MTPTALKEAAQVGVPRDKIVGNRVLRGTGMVPAGRRRSASSAPAFWAREPLPAHPGHPHLRLCPGQGTWAGRRCRHGVLEPGRAGRRAHHGGHPHGHAPLRQPAPDGGAGAVGAEHLTHHRGAQGWGRRVVPPITLSCRDHEGAGCAIPAVGRHAVDGAHRLDGTDQALVRPWWRHRRPSMRRRKASRRGLSVGA